MKRRILRKRRVLAILLLVLLLLPLVLSACETPESDYDKPLQPFFFYYRKTVTDFSSENGLIASELRDLGTAIYSDYELFSLYFQGPLSEELTSPIPRGTELRSAERSGDTLILQLVQASAAGSGIDQSILDACLLKTALQLEGVRRIRIHVEDRAGLLLREKSLSENDVMFYDSGEIQESREITLYFTNSQRRLLLAEKRSLPLMEETSLPKYIVEELIEGPKTVGMVSLLPQGTTLLDINVDNGTCAVDFNADFWNNRPRRQQEELLVLMSLVNSLCELDEIRQVQFYVEGQKLKIYYTLDLSQPFTADSTLIGPLRTDWNEFEGVLCMPGVSDSLLHSFAVRVRSRGELSREEALLQVLLTRQDQNGLHNPLYKKSVGITVAVRGAAYVVEVPPATLDAIDPAERTAALRSIAATLTSIGGIRRVAFTSGGVQLENDASSPAADWFCDGRLPSEEE